MDSRKTTHGDGDERTTENVVRLPRDWLGPREELVPMGSRARTADTADDAPGESLPPTAASFWDEDSGSLQAPMQAAADAWHGQWEPASSEPSESPASARHHASIPRPRLPTFLSGGAAPHRRGGATALVGLVAACLLVVLAVIGQTEGGARNAGDRTTSSSRDAPFVTATGVNRARPAARTPVVSQITAEPSSHRSSRSRAHRHPIHVTPIRRRSKNRLVPRSTQPVRTAAPAYIRTPTTIPTPNAPPSGSTPSSLPSSSSQQQPAFGPSGSLGPGSSPDS